MISRIEIVPKNKDGLYPSEVRLDGNKLECVRSIDYLNVAGEIPTARIEFGMPSIDGKADVELEHPEFILRHCNTCDLVKELRKREGVEVSTIAPHTTIFPKAVEGPAIVLTVID